MHLGFEATRNRTGLSFLRPPLAAHLGRHESAAIREIARVAARRHRCRAVRWVCPPTVPTALSITNSASLAGSRRILCGCDPMIDHFEELSTAPLAVDVALRPGDLDLEGK